MEFSVQQLEAINCFKNWYNKKDSQVFKLFGYAGTGKTTIAKHIASLVKEPVYFAAYTGKAVDVLKKKGCDNAQTIHKLIYISMGEVYEKKQEIKKLEQELVAYIKNNNLEDASADEISEHSVYNSIKQDIIYLEKNMPLLFSLKENSQLDKPCLVIIDECSMIDEKTALDLLTFPAARFVLLGDSGQLPPVKGENYFMNNPHVLLDSVQRQVKDSPILMLATLAREDKPLPVGVHGTSSVIKRSDITDTLLLEYNQIIVGKNITKDTVNEKIRQLLIKEHVHHNKKLPTLGDKLICEKNNYKVGLFKGSMWFVDEIYFEGVDEYTADAVLSSEEDRNIKVETNISLIPFMNIPWEKRNEYAVPFSAIPFSYGYALTAHKAQGSQWSSVLIYNEASIFKNDASKWLYTAITRASEKATIAM